MSGNRRLGPRQYPGLESPNPAAKAPTPDGATFRDLLIFEERLKQNAARLLRRKRKYQTTLFLLCTAILFLTYHVVLVPQTNLALHYFQLALLVVCCTTLFLFFASGMYAERIVAANRFVPQANRALRPFNMYLNIRRPPKVQLWKRVLLPWRVFEEVTVSKSTKSQLITKSNHPFVVSSNSPLPSKHTTSNDTNGAPPPTIRRVQIPPIPPSTNPRGEIIFSNRVSPAFREGYERYRNAFERRRKEKLEAAAQETGWSWRRTFISPQGTGQRNPLVALLCRLAWWSHTPSAQTLMAEQDQEKGGVVGSGRSVAASQSSSSSSSSSSNNNSRSGSAMPPIQRRSPIGGSRTRSDSAASSASIGSARSAASSSSRSSNKKKANAGGAGSVSPRTRARELVDEHHSQRPSPHSGTGNINSASRRSSVSSSSSTPGDEETSGGEGAINSVAGSERPRTGRRRGGAASSTGVGRKAAVTQRQAKAEKEEEEPVVVAQQQQEAAQAGTLGLSSGQPATSAAATGTAAAAAAAPPAANPSKVADTADERSDPEETLREPDDGSRGCDNITAAAADPSTAMPPSAEPLSEVPTDGEWIQVVRRPRDSSTS